MPFNPLHWFNKPKLEIRTLLHTSAVFRYKVGYRRNGVNYWKTDWVNNLILDSGLDMVGTTAWQSCWNTCLFGDQVSPTPVARNSGAVTFTTIGTACVASGGFFVSDDVGRLIKFDDTDGQERYITAFTDSTHVTLGVAPSPAIAAETATIWYVNQTALESLYSATSSYQAGAGNNGTTAIANVVTYKRTFIGSAVGAPVTLTEIGFNNGSGNVDIFDRDIIIGGIGLSVGDQPIATAELILTINPAVSTAVGNVGTGFDTSGDMIICGMQYNASLGAISYVDTNGATQSSNCAMEPNSIGVYGMKIVTGSFSLPAFSNGLGPAFTGVDPDSTSNASYSAGNFYRDRTANSGTTTANGTIYGFAAGPINQAVWVHRLTTPFTKTNAQIMNFTTRISWQRLLQN